MAESSPVPLQIDAHTAHAFRQVLDAVVAVVQKHLDVPFQLCNRYCCPCTHMCKSNHKTSQVLSHIWDALKFHTTFFCQGQEFHDPDWRLSVQQWWRSIAENSGTRISMTDNNKIDKHCLHLTFSSQTVMITESFSLGCLDWRLHPGAMYAGFGVQQCILRWRKHLWRHLQWWRLRPSPHAGEVLSKFAA